MLRSTHRRHHAPCFLAIAIAVAIQQRPVAARPAQTASPDFGAIAPAFVPNSGQADASVRFLGVGGGRPVFLTTGDMRIVDPVRRTSLWLTFVDSAATSIVGESATGGAVSFITHRRGADRMLAYRDVVYRRVWPGIDARITGVVSGVEYSFEIAPHADPESIHIRYRGADRVTLTGAGEVILDAGGSTIVDRAPIAYQRVNGRTRPVEARFVQHGDDLTFAVGAYDRTRPLVIDPTLVYSTYLGSSGYDVANAIAIDSSGAAYVTGETRWSDFPATPGAYQTTFRGAPDSSGGDAFVAKINAAGTHFDYVTYLGGSGGDQGLGIAVDAAGNAYVTGITSSDDFPTTAGATAKRSGIDGFLTKLNASGSALVYSTFFGVGFDVRIAGVAVDASGNAYVAGTTQSIYVPVSSGGQTFSASHIDEAYVLKFNATGQVTYGTYLGGMGSDATRGVAVDGSGHAYVVGNTTSMDRIAMSQTGTPVQPDPNSAVFQSTDGGQTFVPANHGLYSSIVDAVAIDPQQAGTMYEATFDRGLLKSTDGGNSWFPINNGFGSQPEAWDIVVNPNTPTTLLALVSSQSTRALDVFRSLDGGGTWTDVLQDVSQVAYAASNPSIVYATTGSSGPTGSGVVRSSDGGATWRKVLSGSARNLAVDPTNASVVYVGTWSGQVLKSSNAGASWTGQTVDTQIACLAVDPTSPNTVWVGGASGKVFKSSDGGGTWAVQPAAVEPPGAGPNQMTFDGGTLYIGYLGSGPFSVAKTSDQGASWSQFTIRGNVMPVRGITARNGVVFVATQAFSDAFLFKVDTNASSNSIMWGTYIGGSLDDFAAGVAVDPAGNPVVAVRTSSHDFPMASATDYRPSVVARVSSDGSAYTVSSYAGPAGPSYVRIAGVAVDPNGIAYITGMQGQSDPSVWIDRVDASGATTAEYTLNGSHSNVGSNADTPTGIAVDGAGGAYVTGFTSTIDFPTTANAPQPFYGSGASDAFISKVSFSDTPPPPPPPPTNIALNKPVVVSSLEASQYAGANAVDGSLSTRWSSQFSDPQWIYVDLGQTYAINEVILRWETAFGADYQVQVSDDAATWTTIRSVTGGDGGVDDLTGLSGTGRYLRIYGTRRGTAWGYSLWELEVYGTASTPPPPPGLPGPWISRDVGAVGVAGSASYNTGVFTVKGSGADIWGTADAFQYVYQSLAGDGQIEARVTGVQNTSPYAKGGVIFRDGTGASAAQVILDVKPDGCVEFMSRPNAGAATTFVAGSTCGLPASLRLTRAGSTFSAAVFDGATWSTIGTTTATMASTATVGLAVTSHDNTMLNTSTFDTVSVTAAAPPPSSNVVVYASDVPDGSVHGSWTKTSDSTSPNGVKLATPDVGLTTAPVASPTHYVDVTFNAAAGTAYTLWLRLQALNNSKYNDSVWVQFSDALANGSSVYPIGSIEALLVNLATDGTASSLSGWGWQNTAYWLSQATTVTFATSGQHTLRIQVREDGVQFDQIVLSPNQYRDAPPGPVSNDSTIVPK